MKIFRNLSAVPAGAVHNGCVTIGNFDGVHRGHRALLGQTREAARQQNGVACAVTFWPHPRAVLSQNAPQLVATLDQREAWIAETGIDVLVVQSFDREFSATPPEQFLQTLVQTLDAKRLILGHDFRFGKGGKGSVQLARQLAPSLKIEVEEFAQVYLHESVVSSSHVREALADGDVRKAHEYLGRPWQIWGQATSGAGRGRTLGFPTVNFKTDNDLLVPDGVYGGRIRLANGQRLVAAISVGINPTFGSEPRHVEAYLLDAEQPNVGGVLQLEFLAYLRAQITYSHAGKLIEQIEGDVANIRELAVREQWLAAAP